MIDPNPLVAGKGIEILRINGILAEVGLLEQSASALNRSYFEQLAVRAEQTKIIATPNFLEVSLANAIIFNRAV
jgi:diaminohydroxyphosphoribosylaminopyrimidine deaminase/5-amino-6-(5-phosphoribosylamino)uracil reductase